MQDGTNNPNYCDSLRLFPDLYPLKDDLHKVEILLFLLARWRLIVSKGKTSDAAYCCSFNFVDLLFR